MSLVGDCSLGLKSIEFSFSHSNVWFVASYAPFEGFGQQASLFFWSRGIVRFLITICDLDACNICITFNVMCLVLRASCFICFYIEDLYLGAPSACRLAHYHPFIKMAAVCRFALKVWRQFLFLFELSI